MRSLRPWKSLTLRIWLVGAHDVEAVVPVGEALHALGLELGEHLLGELALGELPERCLVMENEGKVERLEFIEAERSELGGGRRQQLHGAELQRLQLFLVLVEGRVGVDLDLGFAAGVLLRQLLELLRGFALRRVGGHHVAELDDDGSLRRGRRDPGRRRGRQRARTFKHLTSVHLATSLLAYSFHFACPSGRQLSPVIATCASPDHDTFVA